MRRIYSYHSNKDRIVCEATMEKLHFYYQSARTHNKYWLFDSETFSGSVFSYFRDRGRAIDENSYSLTVGELYRFNKYYNPKLSKTINRIPAQVDYIICEITEKKHIKLIKRRKTPANMCTLIIGIMSIQLRDWEVKIYEEKTFCNL